MKFTGQLQWTDYLNAQLLHMKPNKTLRTINYVSFSVMGLASLWGFYILYLFAIGEWHSSLDSILMIFLFPAIFAIVIPLYRFVLLPKLTKKIFNQQKELQAPFEMEITEINLVASNEFGNSIRPWKNFIKWKENEELIILYHSDVMFTIIPKRLFTDPQQLETIKSYITKNGIKTEKSNTLRAVYLVVLALFISVLLCNQTLNTHRFVFKQRYIDYLEALVHVLEVRNQALGDKPLLFDESWKKEMGQSLETLNLKSDELAKLNPRYFYLHTTTVNLANETHLFSDTLMKSINGLDINNSNIDLSESVIHLDNMSTMMKEISSKVTNNNSP